MCFLADCLGLRPTDANTRAMFSGVRTENGRKGGFIFATEPSSRHCLTHRRIALEMWLHVDSVHGQTPASLSPRPTKPTPVSVPVRTISSTAHTRSVTPQRAMLTNFKVAAVHHGTLGEKLLTMLHYFCRTLHISLVLLTAPFFGSPDQPSSVHVGHIPHHPRPVTLYAPPYVC